MDVSGKNILEEIRATVQVTIPVQVLTDLTTPAGASGRASPAPADILCARSPTRPHLGTPLPHALTSGRSLAAALI